MIFKQIGVRDVWLDFCDRPLEGASFALIPYVVFCSLNILLPSTDASRTLLTALLFFVVFSLIITLVAIVQQCDMARHPSVEGLLQPTDSKLRPKPKIKIDSEQDAVTGLLYETRVARNYK
jgi:hypothetical protein